MNNQINSLQKRLFRYMIFIMIAVLSSQSQADSTLCPEDQHRCCQKEGQGFCDAATNTKYRCESVNPTQNCNVGKGKSTCFVYCDYCKKSRSDLPC